ncbi:O-antigen ligase family protein [Geminicoccus roseus]|uniref:O-antigen ligase family protein n=1 Tax=Geminicoccus roseus TaxID=404900 RepID=UPI0004117497|nr:O-antigen ligase family protein [Geminicoccus roseus]
MLNLPKIAPLRGLPTGNPVVRLLLDLFSFEALFVLFLFAGRYKADPRFAFIPIDPTILFLVASIAVGLVLIFQEKLYLPGAYALGVWTVFLVYMWIGLIWTEGRMYGREKLMLATITDTWCLIAGALIMANSRERVRRFMRLVVLFAIWLGVEALLAWARQGFQGRLLINNGDNYLGFGRVCGMGAIIACAFWATRSGLTFARIGLMALLGMFMLVLLIGGGRGPLVAGVVPMLLIAVIGWKVTRGGRVRVMKMQIPILLALVAIVGVIIYAFTSPDADLGTLSTLARFRGLLSGSELASSSDFRRTANLEAALEWIPRAPIFGHGIGSWPILVHHGDFQDHPHNFILDIMFDFGLVGLAIMIGVFWACLRNISVHRLRTDPLLLASAMLCINVLMNAMTSGDLPENRQVFVMLGLLLMRSEEDEEEEDVLDGEDDEPAGVHRPWVVDDADDELAAFRHLRPRAFDDTDAPDARV